MSDASPALSVCKAASFSVCRLLSALLLTKSDLSLCASCTHHRQQLQDTALASSVDYEAVRDYETLRLDPVLKTVVQNKDADPEKESVDRLLWRWHCFECTTQLYVSMV